MVSALLPQEKIKVDLNYYDDTEKHLLLKFPSSVKIEQIVEEGVEIPMAEFLTYYLFYRKRPGMSDYRDYKTIGKKFCIALAHMDGSIECNGHSICIPAGIEEPINEVSEHIGEAIGLAVMNRIHGLTEADWTRIRARGGTGAVPSFDFQIASTGEQFIQVETKGSSVKDNRVKLPTVINHKRKIKEKKRVLSDLATEGKDLYPSSLRYGTITVVDSRCDGNVMCWLVDPPSEETTDDPKHFRLLARLHFLHDWISFISPRSQLSSALATRILALKHLSDPFELDSIPLLRGQGTPFDYHSRNFLDIHSSFFANKSHIVDGPAGGVVLQLSDRALFFAGIRDQLVDDASTQSFNEIMNRSFPTATMQKTVECVVGRGRYRDLYLPNSIKEKAQKSQQYVKFCLHGQIHYSRGGLVFGVLPLPER